MGSEDLNSYQDLQEHFSNFSLIVQQFNKTKIENCNFSKTLQRLASDSETLRIGEKTLIEQLQTLTKTYQKEDSINLLYIKLKDKYTDLEKRYDFVTQQNILVQERNLIEITELEEKFKRDKNKLVQEFTQKLMDSQEELVEERNVYLKRENELYNELQLVQASNALQCDESQSIDKSLRFQLKNAFDSHNALRQEYLSFKTHNESELNAAKKLINDLKCKLRFTEQQLRINQDQLFKLNTELEAPRAAHQDKSGVYTLKYDALNISDLSTNKAHSSQDKTSNQSLVMPTSNSNTIKSISNVTSHKNKIKYTPYLPPLKQLTKIPKSKKMKLYTPGTVDFKNIDQL